MKRDILGEKFGFNEDQMKKLFDIIQKDVELRVGDRYHLPPYTV